jgi:hypothetical protein
MGTHRKDYDMIIGLCSLVPQVGKTTCAEYLQKNHRFIHLEMSGVIVKFCEKYLGYNGNKSDPKQRKILQEVGLAWKSIYPDIWLYHNLAEKFHSYSSLKEYDPTIENYFKFKENILKMGIVYYFGESSIVISGIRSEGESDSIKQLGGKVFLIERPIKVEGGSHKVENGLSNYKKFDEIIKNEGTIEDLYKKIENKILWTK